MAPQFPKQHILPKSEIGADAFVAEHPEYDGRGVIIAIFDTGVDPAAPGMQTTPDGRPKIVDIVDATGSGDVDTSTERAIGADGTVDGLTGRKLRIPAEWNIPSRKCRVGVKRLYELCPKSLVERLQKGERRRNWDAVQQQWASQLARELREWEAQHPNPSKDDKKKKEELEARAEQLAALERSFEDPGPVCDVVVFHDGTHWRGAIDLSECGDLSTAQAMADYSVFREYSRFGAEDLMTYSVNVYDDGAVLSIVTNCGSHGTHVAGIAAAYHPEDPSRNGIAPGAQLVSVKIGDSRLGSMETATGIVRGVLAAMRAGCHVINMSYGEATKIADVGRVVAACTDIVWRKNVVFVSSAGNNGPALSTVGCPGGTTSAIIGVGAFVSSDMMDAEYSMYERPAGMQYTWSSRGPTPDGDFGVSISAAGGAIAPVPQWTLKGTQLMNGTSMSSPSASGAVALVLSGLLARGVPYTPFSIRRALEHTARPVERDVFGHGKGMIRVGDAFEHAVFVGTKHARWHLTAIESSFGPERNNARGLYLREAHETNAPGEHKLTLEPKFPEGTASEVQVAYEVRLSLSCTVPWVRVPPNLVLMNEARTFNIWVDPTSLPPGAHAAEILGHDSDAPDAGPLVRVAVTVIRTLPANTLDWESENDYGAGEIRRDFFVVPEGSTWAEIRLYPTSFQGAHRFVLHTVQLLPQRAFRDHEYENTFLLTEGGAPAVHQIPVVAGSTIEVCVAKWWAAVGTSRVRTTVAFHGVSASGGGGDIVLQGAKAMTRVEVRVPVRTVEVAATATLKHWVQTLRPTDAKIAPLSPTRDVLPRERQVYELVLTYSFSQTESSEVTPYAALLSDYLYESEFEGQFWMICDANKRAVAYGDAFPDHYTAKLDKGDYVLRLQVRHDKTDVLEKLKELPVALERPLGSGKEVAVDVFAELSKAQTGGVKYKQRLVKRGGRLCLYLGAPASDKIPKDLKPGDYMRGLLVLAKPAGATSTPPPSVASVPVVYYPAPPAASKPAPPAASDEEPAKADDVLRDAKVAALSKLTGDERARTLKELVDAYPRHIPLLSLALQSAEERTEAGEPRLAAVVAAADAVIAALDLKELAAHYGTNVDSANAEQSRARKDMDKKKEALLDALNRKGRALADAVLDASREMGRRQELAGQLDAVVSEMVRWVSATDTRVLYLTVARERFQGNYGLALRALVKYVSQAPASEGMSRRVAEWRVDLIERLGWTHISREEAKWLTVKYPAKYPLF